LSDKLVVAHTGVGPEKPSFTVGCNSQAHKSVAHMSAQVAHNLSVGNPMCIAVGNPKYIARPFYQIYYYLNLDLCLNLQITIRYLLLL
jgi:hypothetical protein